MPTDADDADDDISEYTLLSKACLELEPVINKQFKMFAKEYAHNFVEAAKGESEHKKEYMQLHQRYMKSFESTVTDYIKSEGADEDQFYTECQDSISGKFCALFEEDINKEFVLRLLAITDYLHFYDVMVNACKNMLLVRRGK